MVEAMGLEPETCGFENEPSDDREMEVKAQFRYPFV
jgi:hypothetical protein